MAKIVLKNALVEVAGVDLSDHFQSVTIEDAAEEIDFTGFSASGYREIGAGLKDVSITGAAFQDFDASEVDATLWPLYQSGGTFSVKVKAENVATSPTNPEYSITARLLQYSPIAGGVGEASTTDVTFRNAGTAGLVRGTA